MERGETMITQNDQGETDANAKDGKICGAFANIEDTQLDISIQRENQQDMERRDQLSLCNIEEVPGIILETTEDDNEEQQGDHLSMRCTNCVVYRR